MTQVTGTPPEPTGRQDAMVLVVSSYGDEVNLVPLRQAMQDHPDGSVMMFGVKPPAAS
jgi:hypothetical protein